MKHIVLQLHITSQCNLRCKHCYIDNYGVEMSYNDIKKVIKQFNILRKKIKKLYHEPVVAHIHMTGGEPFTHSQIIRILRLMILNRNNYYFGIMSNGTILNPIHIILLRLIRLKSFQVSIDGSEETHDSIRGEGNLKNVVKSLDKLYQYGIPTRVSFTANKKNYKEFPLVANICRNHHVRTLWSDRYIPFEHNNAVQPLDKKLMAEYVMILQLEHENDENKKCGLYVQNSRALQFLCSGETPYYCRAGETLITVDEHGNIFPCRRLPINCGNIKTSSLVDVYFNNNVFTNLRNHNLNDKCIECKFSKACKGGERCFTFAKKGDYTLPDPCCWINE